MPVSTASPMTGQLCDSSAPRKRLIENWRNEWPMNGKPQRSWQGKGELTEAHCRKTLSEIYERAVGEPLHFGSTRKYLDEWLEGIKPTVDENTLDLYKRSVDRFLKHLGAKANHELKDITPTDILRWRDKLKETGLSAPTVNGHFEYRGCRQIQSVSLCRVSSAVSSMCFMLLSKQT
jgi:hypothetical protein